MRRCNNSRSGRRLIGKTSSSFFLKSFFLRKINRHQMPNATCLLWIFRQMRIARPRIWICWVTKLPTKLARINEFTHGASYSPRERFCPNHDMNLLFWKVRVTARPSHVANLLDAPSHSPSSSLSYFIGTIRVKNRASRRGFYSGWNNYDFLPKPPQERSIAAPQALYEALRSTAIRPVWLYWTSGFLSAKSFRMKSVRINCLNCCLMFRTPPWECLDRV